VNSALYVAIGRRVPRLTTQGDTQATSRPVSANLTSGGQENWHPRPFMTFADIFTRPGPRAVLTTVAILGPLLKEQQTAQRWACEDRS